MISIGKSVYPDCESPDTVSVPGIGIPCYGQFGKSGLDRWCRRCLIGAIKSLRQELRSVAEHAERAAKG